MLNSPHYRAIAPSSAAYLPESARCRLGARSAAAGAPNGNVRQIKSDPAMSLLLHVARHIAVERDPDEEWPIEPLQITQHFALGHFDLNAEVLLRVNRHRFGEAEGRLRIRVAVRCHLAVLRVWPCASGEEPGRYLDHNLLADEKGGDGVVDELADQRAET